jgi:hypothetical protein
MLFKEFDHLLLLFSQIHSKQTFIMKREKDCYLLFGFSLFFLFFSPGLLETGSIPLMTLTIATINLMFMGPARNQRGCESHGVAATVPTGS